MVSDVLCKPLSRGSGLWIVIWKNHNLMALRLIEDVWHQEYGNKKKTTKVIPIELFKDAIFIVFLIYVPVKIANVVSLYVNSLEPNLIKEMMDFSSKKKYVSGSTFLSFVLFQF